MFSEGHNKRRAGGLRPGIAALPTRPKIHSDYATDKLNRPGGKISLKKHAKASILIAS